jgi:hypothetical protein
MWFKYYVEVKIKIILPIEHLNHKREFFFKVSSALSSETITGLSERTPLEARQFEPTHYNELIS